MALVGAATVGPRIGKFVNGSPQTISGHTVPVGLLMMCKQVEFLGVILRTTHKKKKLKHTVLK